MSAAAVLTERYSGAGWRQVLAWACAAVATLALCWAVTLARLLRSALSRADHHGATDRARTAELAHLASVRLPALAERARTRRADGVPGPLAHTDEVGEEFARTLEAVIEAAALATASRRYEERPLPESARAAFVSLARAVHSLALVQQRSLDRVERAVEDPGVVTEVLLADHAAARMIRKAQTLLVMCGVWPASEENRPVSLYDCVRAAQSRILDFARVELHGEQWPLVTPPATEGVIHTLAELLENATAHSPSGARVVVTVREVGAGAVVEIDDAGRGMSPEALRHAMGLLREGPGLPDRPEPGGATGLGLACAGRWTRELGFGVDLAGTSAYGGTRAVVFLPHRLLTEPPSRTPERGPVARPAWAGTPADQPRHPAAGPLAPVSPTVQSAEGPLTPAYPAFTGRTGTAAADEGHHPQPAPAHHGGYQGAMTPPAGYQEAPQHTAAPFEQPSTPLEEPYTWDTAGHTGPGAVGHTGLAEPGLTGPESGTHGTGRPGARVYGAGQHRAPGYGAGGPAAGAHGTVHDHRPGPPPGPLPGLAPGPLPGPPPGTLPAPPAARAPLPRRSPSTSSEAFPGPGGVRGYAPVQDGSARWTPEDAGSSVSNVVAGARRGRADLTDARIHQPPTIPETPHGGRP
ncbi:ATP-binding protein [Streptomyces sp. NPDC057638]|uniref:sensor histidine kinase n=1 Tax=Streptomyces sp. NPDC057638 TaxID=3346190 RepID=UPI0036D0E3B8